MALLTGLADDLRKLATSPTDQELPKSILKDAEYLYKKLLTP